MHHDLLGLVVTWDPFIRGVLIVAVAFLVLCGSVYLLLATNTGVRLGFLLAAAGLSGWCSLMGVVWMVTGSTADIGRPASWKVEEVVTGDLAKVGTSVPSFPKGFTQVGATEPEHADASSSADKILVPATGAEGGGSTSRFTSPFTSADQYVIESIWRHDPTTVYHIRKHKITPFGHDKHTDVVQVRPVVVQPPNPDGTPVKPVPDLSKPLTSIVMVRDLGSYHQPQFLFAVASFIVFAIVCYVLHDRDKKIRAIRESATVG